MNATVYGRGRMVLPAKVRKEAGIRKGDVFAVHTEGAGRLVLVRMEIPSGKSKVRIVRRKGRHPIAVGGRPITSAEVKELLAEFP